MKDDEFAKSHEKTGQPAQTNGWKEHVPAQAYGTSVDISSRENIYRWVEDAAAKFGRIDIIVANG